MNEDKASRYHRLKRVTSVASVLWSSVFLAGLTCSGGSEALRNAARAMSDSVPSSLPATVTVCFYVCGLTLMSEVARLPLNFYSGYVLERRYGLSRQSVAGWLGDQFKGVLLVLVLGIVAAALLYFFIRRSPESWWLPAGALFALFVVGLAHLGPILLLPLFYRVTPLGRESLRDRLVRLAERAGTQVVGAYEWGLGENTRKANAALTGVSGTRRILVSDTMLTDYSEDEIEVVLAHELAHHVHGDIWKGLVLESGLIVFGFFAAARVLAALTVRLGLDGPGDVAGLPILLLAAGAVSLVMLPAARALSRAHERQADRFALELTRNPPAFISAMKRLAAQNLADERPSKLVEWLFHSHPPLGDRIDAARQFSSRS